MHSTRKSLWPLYTSWDIFPDDLIALESAIVVVQQATENGYTVQPDQLIRSNAAQEVDMDITVEMLLERCDYVEYV
jgi:hypothetical protein